MPVNYMTDLRDLKDFGYVQQMPLEALFKNLGYKQAKFDQAAQKIQADVDTLLVNAYGQDIEKRNQIINQVNQELSKFAGMDMSDPKVQTQITSFIGQVGSSKDLVGIKLRSDAYDKAQTKKDKLLADGKTTISPWNDPTLEMEGYYAGKEPYNPNKRFTGEVYVDYDFNTFGKAVSENTPELSELKKNGKYDELSVGKTHGALSSMWKQGLDADQNAKRDLRGRWEAENSGRSFGEEDRVRLTMKMRSAEAIANSYSAAAQAEASKINPDPALLANYQEKAARATTEYQRTYADFNNVDDAVAAETNWNSYVQEKADKFSDTQVSYALKARIEDKFDLLAQQHANDMEKLAAEIEGRKELAIAKGQIPNELDEKTAFTVLDEFKSIKEGLHDTEGVIPRKLWWDKTSDNWESDDFKDTYEIQAGIKGAWRPVENLPFINDFFGQSATQEYDAESGNTVRTSGKQVIATFRNAEGKIMVIVEQDGAKRAVVVTDNDIKDKVTQRLKGKNLPTYIDRISNYPMGSSGASGSTGSTGSTGVSASTGSTGSTGTSGVGEASYNPKDSTTTFNFE